QFQEWRRFAQLYYDLNPSLGGRGSMQLERQAGLAARLARPPLGAPGNRRAPRPAAPPVLAGGARRARPVPGPPDAGPPRADAVNLPDRSVKPPAMRAVTVVDAVNERLDVRKQIRAQEGASPRDEPAIKRLQQQERDIAEAMGVAAGVRWSRSEFGSTGTLAV